MIHHRIKQALRVSILAPLIGLLFITNSFAADRSITLNDGQHIKFKSPIGQVFINNPDIVDYKVINDSTLVVFANGIGQSRLIVYGIDDEVLLSDRIIVDLNLTDIRRQLKFHFLMPRSRFSQWVSKLPSVALWIPKQLVTTSIV